eukprot:14646137-Alexandrium_andersonii.AAC.1
MSCFGARDAHRTLGPKSPPPVLGSGDPTLPLEKAHSSSACIAGGHAGEDPAAAFPVTSEVHHLDRFPGYNGRS